jgi:hypothetical protein
MHKRLRSAPLGRDYFTPISNSGPATVVSVFESRFLGFGMGVQERGEMNSRKRMATITSNTQKATRTAMRSARLSMPSF